MLICGAKAFCDGVILAAVFSAASHLPFWYLWCHKIVVGGIMLSMQNLQTPEVLSQWTNETPGEQRPGNLFALPDTHCSLHGMSLGVVMLLHDLFFFKFAAGNQPRKAHLSLLCIFSCR